MIHDKLCTLWSYLSFSYLIGNSDLHLKNLSLIERRHGEYVLSLFYDLLSSTIATDDSDDFALMVNGKNRHLRKKIFSRWLRLPGSEREEP